MTETQGVEHGRGEGTARCWVDRAFQRLEAADLVEDVAERPRLTLATLRCFQKPLELVLRQVLLLALGVVEIQVRRRVTESRSE